MAEDSSMHPDKVAELEHRLADAAAEVARVQAELAGARGTTLPAAGSSPDTSKPHLIMVNGQQVTPGSGDFAGLLQQAMGASATPVVVVNGQQVSGGAPLDLSGYVTPQVMQQLQSSLQMLGLDHGIGSLFGHAAGAGTGGGGNGPAAAMTLDRLADPPRHVPFSLRLATFDLSFYELFLLVIGTAAPIIVWLTLPEVIPAALIAAVAVIAVFRGRRYVRRIGILRWGKVAEVSTHQTLSSGTYYSGMTYNNMLKRQAHGWDATTSFYSGPGYKNRIEYTLDGRPGALTFRGLLYDGGVILADSREPTRALCISQFPYSVRPGLDGQLPSYLSPWMCAGIFLTLVVEGGLIVTTVLAVLKIWLGR